MGVFGFILAVLSIIHIFIHLAILIKKVISFNFYDEEKTDVIFI